MTREFDKMKHQSDSVEFVIDRIETFAGSNKPTKSFLRTDSNYGLKSYDKSNKVLPLSQHQNDSGSSKNNTPNVKDDLNITRAKLTHTSIQRKTSNR